MSSMEAVRLTIPTRFGVFQAHAFEQPSGFVYVALTVGDIGDGSNVMVRVHSECLTGDALGSLRCDCGVQLGQSLRLLTAAGRGVFIYATGHEGRGIGLVNKLRAYVAQDKGADTVDANHLLGLPIDGRDYSETAAVLSALGVRSVRLLTNNPHKVEGLRAAGTTVEEVIPLPTAPHHRNAGYLTTKTTRMDHVRPMGAALAPLDEAVVDVLGLVDHLGPRAERPAVVLKYAQTLDGRIATSSGDARWISGEEERTVSHALRAASDAVLVGIGTVLADDPQLTVRMVPGASPMRVVLDSALRIPDHARVLDEDAPTVVLTTERSSPTRRAALRARGVVVEVVADLDGRVDLAAGASCLRSLGIELLLVEGGAQVITGLLRARLVDRLIVAIAPLIIGTGTSAVGQLDVARVADGIRLINRTVTPIGADVLLAWDVDGAPPERPA
jgi:3,4-dihydroxy 2-butanone 4-phosphate synthase/GTP cyclohydrolase II